MAVVERADREVVVLVGVPLMGRGQSQQQGSSGQGARKNGPGRKTRMEMIMAAAHWRHGVTYGISEGVSGSEHGGGTSINMGCDA